MSDAAIKRHAELMNDGLTTVAESINNLADQIGRLAKVFEDRE
jgi:hypothetical protein